MAWTYVLSCLSIKYEPNLRLYGIHIRELMEMHVSINEHIHNTMNVEYQN